MCFYPAGWRRNTNNWVKADSRVRKLKVCVLPNKASPISVALALFYSEN